MHALPPLGGVSGKCQNIVPNVGRRMFKVGLETVSKGLHLVPAPNVSLLKQVPDVGGGCNLGGINGCKLAMGANQLGRVPINCLIGKL